MLKIISTRSQIDRILHTITEFLEKYERKKLSAVLPWKPQESYKLSHVEPPIQLYRGIHGAYKGKGMEGETFSFALPTRANTESDFFALQMSLYASDMWGIFFLTFPSYLSALDFGWGVKEFMHNHLLKHSKFIIFEDPALFQDEELEATSISIIAEELKDFVTRKMKQLKAKDRQQSSPYRILFDGWFEGLYSYKNSLHNNEWIYPDLYIEFITTQVNRVAKESKRPHNCIFVQQYAKRLFSEELYLTKQYNQGDLSWKEFIQRRSKNTEQRGGWNSFDYIV